jgi:hypothetical protein
MKREMRDYFGDRCCYCDQPAKSPHAHVDHAVHDGGNHLGNLVLSCADCNGNKKRETAWDAYLATLCADDVATRTVRADKIRKWRADHPRATVAAPTADVLAARGEVDRAMTAFVDAFKKLRDAVGGIDSNAEKNR